MTTPTILFICTDNVRFGGSSLSLLSLIKALGDRIYPIVLFAKDGMVPQRFKQEGIETIIEPFADIWYERKRLKTIVHHPSRSGYYRYMKTDLRCAKHLIPKLKDRNIQIVHTNTSVCTIGVLLALRLKAKHVWHIREFIEVFGRRQLISTKTMARIIPRHANATICISHALMARWSFPSEDNIYIIGDGMFAGTPPPINHNKEKYILFCAQKLCSFKGTEMAVEAFCASMLPSEGYQLTLVGDYDEGVKRKLLQLASKSGNSSTLQFAGNVSDPSSFFASASAFLMCSLFEGLGRVTLEAMYYGSPVIARATGATPEIVKNGKTGYLFNTAEECARLLSAIPDTNTSSMVSRAQAFVAEHFDSARYSDKIMDIYQQLFHPSLP